MIEEVIKKEKSAGEQTKNKSQVKKNVAPKTVTKSKKSTKDSQKKEDKIKKELKKLKEKTSELQDKYIRLSAEFDNYRKRTLKEKTELLKSAGESVILNLLPVMDDFERGIQSTSEAKDIEAVKAGINIIYKKFRDFLEQQGVKEIDAKNKEFNTDFHEAVTKIPAPNEEQKGKVVDVIEKGYCLNEKVIRFSKVVIGE